MGEEKKIGDEKKTGDESKLNTKFKDSVFSTLFSDPDVLRELYCALEGVSLPAELPININTLQNLLFVGRINDISFEIGGKLVVLIEHQSTINPNMCFRLLMYIVRVYEKIIDKGIYSTKLLSLPRPEFFVLYNGTSDYPDEKILKLSDMYESLTDLGLPEKPGPALELVAKVININQGRNEKIVKKCKTLSGYSAFVGKVQEYIREGTDRSESLRKAINYCLEHDILKDFFEKNTSEVMRMLMEEWNMDTALAVRFEEGREEGMEKGREDVARNALAKGFPVETIQTITGLNMETIMKLMPL
jgi:predicted transposase/invertase (TIGR01784 family)